MRIVNLFDPDRMCESVVGGRLWSLIVNNSKCIDVYIWFDLEYVIVEMNCNGRFVRREV